MKDSWKELVIGDEINFLGGYPFSSSKFNEEAIGFPLIRIRDLLKSTQETYYSGEYSNSYLIKEGDVLVGMDGDFHLVRWNNSPSLLNQRVLKISGKKSGEIDIDFLFYYLKPFLIDVHNKTTATTVKHLSTFDVSRAVDLFPPLPQQKKIAKILTTVDEVIEQTESAIAKYQAIKQGLMQDLFTRGIDSNTGQLRPAPEDAPELYKESALGLIPREWEVNTFEKICLKVADRDHFTPTYFDQGIPIISPKDFDENHNISFKKCKYISLEAHLKNCKKTDLKTDDLVFTRIGAGLGKITIVQSWMPEFSILHSACMIRTDDKILNSKFLMYFIKGEILQRQIGVEVQSIGVPDLGLDKIRDFKCLFPKNKKEQISIATRLTKVDYKIQTEQESLGKYQQLKSGLMQDLLSGRVGVVTSNKD